MSVLTECSNLRNYQSITTCSELMSNIILHYISKYIKGNSWKNKVKKRRFLPKKLLFTNGRFSPSHLNFKVAIKTKRVVLKVTKIS